MPRALCWSQGGLAFLMSDAFLHEIYSRILVTPRKLLAINLLECVRASFVEALQWYFGHTKSRVGPFAFLRETSLFLPPLPRLFPVSFVRALYFSSLFLSLSLSLSVSLFLSICLCPALSHRFLFLSLSLSLSLSLWLPLAFSFSVSLLLAVLRAVL